MRLASRDQFAAIDALGAEEINLADELRATIADGDRCSLVQLLPALGMFWTVRGEHNRLLVLAEAVTDAVRDWQPPPELADEARGALAITLTNALLTGASSTPALHAILQRLGPDTADNTQLSGMVRILLAYDPADADSGPFIQRIEQLAYDPDRRTALVASQWLCHLRENAGDAVGAIQAGQHTLTLVRDEDGPWAAAMPRTTLSELTMHVGDRAAAVGHARAALPVMERIGAGDDVIQLRALLALCAISDGRLQEYLRCSEEDARRDRELLGGLLRAAGSPGADQDDCRC